MSTPIETMRRFYDLFAARDEDAMRPMLANSVWHVPGENSLAGTYSGPDDVLRLFDRALELSGGTLKYEIHGVVGEGVHAVGLDRVTGTRDDGRTIDMNRVVIAHIADEALGEVWVNPEDGYAFDEFWR